MTVSGAERERIAEQVRRKRESLDRPVAELEADLLANVGRQLGPAATEVVRRAVRYLADRSVMGDGDHQGPNYVRHSIRVAAGTLRWQRDPSADGLVIAILHNAYEVCGLSERDLMAADFSERVASAVRALTIDRSRERDPVYLGEFYTAIDAFGSDAALVRCIDKIDNMLGLLTSDPVGRSYVDLAERFVGPMAHRLSQSLGRHFSATVVHARAGKS